jgi:hypothetical protein
MRQPVEIKTPHPTVLETAKRMGLTNRDLTYLAGLLDLQWPPKWPSRVSRPPAAKKRTRRPAAGTRRPKNGPRPS